MTNQPDIWEELYNQENWGTRAIQSILKDLGGPYDPGPVDGIYGPKTTQAVRNFQGDHGLAVDGVAGPNTRRELFTAYMGGKHDIEIDDSRIMDPKHMGCGEFNPQVDTEEKNEENRRVTFFLFNEERLPNIPCLHGDLAPCEKQMSGGGPHYKDEFKCSFYDSIARECECEGGAVVGSTFGVNSLTLPTHIAPEKETIKIKYEINDPSAVMATATITLKSKSAGGVVWTRPLTGPERTHGTHEIDWDGKIGSHGKFPDSYITIEHSPYEMEITVTGGGVPVPPKQTAEIKVEVAELVIELAPKDHLSNEQDKKVYDQVGAIPATGTVELQLDSNLYAEKGSEMNDNTAFTEYKTLWDKGPRIPMLATAKVFDSTGNKVKSGKAMGNARLLWDYSDKPGTETSFLSTKAPAFISTASKYDTSSPQPSDGDNCHVDRGGKRTGKDRVFAAADAGVTNFKFTTGTHPNRPWGTFTAFEKSGDNEARTGAVFCPARTAGDNYVLHAYLGPAENVNTDDEPPKNTWMDIGIGTFEVWRQIHLTEHHRKCAAITAPVPGIDDYYKDAYIRVANNMGAGNTMSKSDYDSRFDDARDAVPNSSVHKLIRKHALPDGISQYDTQPPSGSSGGGVKGLLGKLFDKGIDWSKLTGGDPTTWVMTVRPYDDFKREIKKKKLLTKKGLATALTNAGLETEVKYANATTSYAADIATEMCKELTKKEGITILQFEWTTSIEQAVRPGRLNGNACFKGRTNTGFALYNPAQDTTGHEIGHCMFMPHAPRPKVSKKKAAAEGIQPDRHDGNDMNCLMSYNRPRPGFCGLCVIRLRGWDATKFDKNGSITKKP
ncbi:MAG: hypothetical protein GF341_08695 [candidate division Zixibacteria bacterium]|nr:hypothetical protein [candidate division Zixibacteria bacterium]